MKVDKSANLLSPLQKFQIATIYSYGKSLLLFFFWLMPMKAISFPSPWATQPKEKHMSQICMHLSYKSKDDDYLMFYKTSSFQSFASDVNNNLRSSFCR